MKAIILKSSLLLLFLGAIAWPSVSDAQQMIVIRVVNIHPFPVLVHSQTFNQFGYPQWVFVTQVAPRSYVDIPNVPIGAVFGVDSPNARRQWPPFRVFIASPYMPNFVYQVPP
jgi:hypothetical protein